MEAPPLKLVFCGTPQFAVPSLSQLALDPRFHVILVVTQPDRPKGRGMELAASAVKQKAFELKLPVVQPEQIKDNAAFRAQLENIQPDVIVVVGYGRIIPKWMLDLPRLGNINLHASLLPKYRGAAPIQWAFANGETMTGNTTMLINEGLDTGDILLQEQIAIEPTDTAVTLAPRMAASGAKLLAETLAQWNEGKIKAHAQNDAQATLAPILKKEDGRIDLTRPAKQITDRLRGFQPWPGAYTTFHDRTHKIIAAQPAEADLAPGALAASDGKLFCGCGGRTAIEITELQPEGKRKMTAKDFLSGHLIRGGERFE